MVKKKNPYYKLSDAPIGKQRTQKQYEQHIEQVDNIMQEAIQTYKTQKKAQKKQSGLTN